MIRFSVQEVEFGNSLPFVLIAGPCQLESRDHAMFMAEKIFTICSSLQISWVFKSSFDKANRTSLHGKRGIGIDNALPILAEIKNNFNCPVITDMHVASQAKILEEVIDIIQIPAFLCRQTDLLMEAGDTKCAVNIKKGQFIAPWDIKNAVIKVNHSGNKKVMLTERGSCFGYNQLINDMKSIQIMAEETKCPIIFDATHSVQQPSGLGNSSGGNRKFIKTLAKAAVAVGVAGIFLETHQDPDNAPSDGPCMLPLAELKNFLIEIKKIDEVVKSL